MKGLDLAKEYFKTYGLNAFKDLDEFKYLAFGLVGSGSECFGFDDQISTDHDFEPGFCVFYPKGVFDSKTIFKLERIYAKLPKEFHSYKRQLISPVGITRHGVIEIESFYEQYLGNISNYNLLYINDFYLAEATNGDVFLDNYGLFTKIRNKLKHYPKDIFLKKLAGNLLLMEQSGEYNYKRCILHNEKGAAQLALYEFVKSTMHVAFLLNKKYMPYYKWSFKYLRTFDCELEKDLIFLISSANDNYIIKEQIIAKIIKKIINQLINIDLLEKEDSLEKIAYKINDLIVDNNLRNQSILEGI